MSELERPPELLRDVSEEVFFEAVSFKSPVYYLQEVAKPYRTMPWWQLIVDYMHDVRPGVDTDKPVSHSVYYGSLLGLRIAEVAKGTEFLDQVALSVARIHTKALAVGAIDENHRKSLMTRTFEYTAERAIAADNPNLVVAKRWEGRLSQDVRTQSIVVDAAAFMLHATYKACDLQAKTYMQTAVDTMAFGTFDWNEAFGELEAS